MKSNHIYYIVGVLIVVAFLTIACYFLWPSDSVSNTAINGDCIPATAEMVLAGGTKDATAVAFKYTQCGPSMPEFEDTDTQIILTGDERKTIADYWILTSNQDTETFLRSLVATLPRPEQRALCTVSSEIISDPEDWRVARGMLAAGETIFVVKADEGLFHPEDEVYSPCAPYGVSNTVEYYKRVSNVLLHIHAGQDTPEFDPTSFKVI